MFYLLKQQPYRQGVAGGLVEPKLMMRCPALQWYTQHRKGYLVISFGSSKPYNTLKMGMESVPEMSEIYQYVS